jgi:multiple sugar transport system ATP-binding protein
MAVVELREVDKTYPGGVQAVRGLSLEVRDGELLVLVGPSGCGKSTVLRMLAGLESVTRGEIVIGGRVVNDLPPQRRNIAMVFQNYALYPHKTVRGNLEFPLRMMKVARSRRKQRVEQVAEVLGLRSLLDQYPRSLSGGQRQRVAMGRAMVREPDVFLLDEPLSNLDAKLRVQIRAEIASLQQQLSGTMVYVTHDQVEAMTLGQRVAVLKGGRLQQIGSGEQLYRRPANVFVARFIGSPGMNLFKTTLQHGDTGGWTIDVAGKPLALPADAVERCTDLDKPRGQQVLAGLRPEAFSLDHASQSAVTMSAKVEAVEILGHEKIVYLDCPLPLESSAAERDEKSSGAEASSAREKLAVRLPGASPPPQAGESLELTVDPAGICLFDAASGRSLEHSAT